MTSSTTNINTDKSLHAKRFIPLLIFLPALILLLPFLLSSREVPAPKHQESLKKKTTLLGLLDLIPSPESIDYVQKKNPYQMHFLLTEQRHPKTWDLSDRIAHDVEAGLQMLLAVDEDVDAKIRSLDRNDPNLEGAVRSIQEAILSGRRIYFFGCQKTGRWTKWVESSIWRPFWKTLRTKNKIWAKVGPKVGETIEGRLIGEMPGADRSLISPLAGWDDLMITGRLQIQERGIEPGDVVMCISASGESPSVIGTLYEALDQWTRRYPYDPEETKKKVFFFFNNPEEELLLFDRCKVVLEEPGFTKINLATGPQALAGATRMQASTIDAFLIAQIFQAAIRRTLRPLLSAKEMASLGFQKPVLFGEKLEEFSSILKEVKKIVPAMANITTKAAKVWLDGRFTTYSALRGFGTVFNDCAERGEAFDYGPLDAVKNKPRKSRIQAWALVPDLEEAWGAILGRPFRGLSAAFYKNRLEQEGPDLDLRQKALENLIYTDNENRFLFDFSFSDFNLRNRAPEEADLGIFVVISPEEDLLRKEDSPVFRFISRYLEAGAKIAFLFITEKKEKDIKKLTRKIPGFDPNGKDILAVLPLGSSTDPLFINRLTALKIILNAHSAAVMALAGRVTGNTVTAMDPADLKSIGRGTFLVLSHVNDVIKKPQWVKRHGIQEPITYGEANAVLFDAIGFMKNKRDRSDKSFEVDLSIIRILEALRRNEAVSFEEAWAIIRDLGLQQYLNDVTS